MGANVLRVLDPRVRLLLLLRLAALRVVALLGTLLDALLGLLLDHLLSLLDDSPLVGQAQHANGLHQRIKVHLDSDGHSGFGATVLLCYCAKRVYNCFLIASGTSENGRNLPFNFFSRLNKWQ